MRRRTSRASQTGRRRPNACPSEALEPRLLFNAFNDISNEFTTVGNVVKYESLNASGAVTDTTTDTVIGAATFGGMNVMEYDSVAVDAGSGDTTTTKHYGAVTSAGLVQYGTTATTSFTGGVSGASTTFSPYQLVFPRTLVVGQPVTDAFTQTETDTGSGSQTATTSRVSESIIESSATTQSVTTPAGTFNATVIEVTTTTTPQGGSAVTNPINYFVAPGVGVVETQRASDGTPTSELIFTNQTPTPTPTPTPAPTPPPVLDPTFNGGQSVTLAFAGRASAVTSTGQTLVAGVVPTNSGGSEAELQRLNPDGSIDTTFGSAGSVVDAATANEAFDGVAVESDGTVVAAGSAGGDLLLEAYTSTGAIDASFGSGGRVVLPVGQDSSAVADGIAIDSGGNLIVTGSADGQFLADRFTAAGAQDPGFNSGAPLLFSAGSTGAMLGPAIIQGNGDIIAPGENDGGVVVARITPGGTLDSSYGTAGIAAVAGLVAPALIPGHPEAFLGFALDSAGDAIVANSNTSGDFATARLTPAGALDSTFGTEGVVTTDINGDDDADFVAVEPNGEIVVAGTTTPTGAAPSDVVAEYLPTGALDTTFATNGLEIYSANFPSATSTAAREEAGVRPDAVGIGGITTLLFGSLQTNGQVVLGASAQGTTEHVSTVRRLNVVGAASPATLPTGALDAALHAALPAKAITGAKEKSAVTVTLTNPSSQPITGSAHVALYLNTIASLTGATPLTTTVKKIKLKARGAKAFRLQLGTLPTVANGSYHLLAGVTAPDGSVTAAAGPTVQLAAPYVQIVPSAAAPLTPTAAPGKIARFSFTLHNAGNIAVNGSAALTLIGAAASSASPVTLATAPLRVRLKAGAKRVYTIRFKVAPTVPAGAYTLSASLNVAALGDKVATDGTFSAAAPLTIT